ncbi:major facilitator superfamily domain-containing protein [Xylariales sp. AK1849]|nr:major facilitator superfamily domain-containing protein [Xylariales sp. AK1849]
MAWAILEPSPGRIHVPGTVQLEEQSRDTATHFEHLKKVIVRGETIILVPQPSDDPNDPLNQPLWRRDLRFLVFAYCTILVVGGIGPILSPLVLDLVQLFNITFTDVSLLTGYSLCATGAIGIFISAVSHKYGKRIPLLFSISCALAGTVWGGLAQSYHSLLGARILQGCSVSMFESVFFAVVGDLYFVHERGIRTSIVTTCVAGLSNLPSVLAGKIATELGWRWVFWLLAIFLVIAVVLSFLFGEETAYQRSPIYNTDLATEDNLDILDAKRAARTDHIERDASALSTVETSATGAIPRKTFFTLLNPYSTNYTDRPLWKLVIDPIAILYHPVVLWAVFLMAFPTLWLIAINLVTAQIFSAPPFLLDTAQLGYFAAGPTVGGALGSLVAGFSSDVVIRYLTRRNGGIYEPEFRLFLIIPGFVLSAIGYFLFGPLIEEGKSPVAMSTLCGLATAALQFIMMSVSTYCVDAYREISVEIFIATMIIKNFLFYGFSYFLNDWIESWGPARLFYTVAGIQLGLCLTVIPLYIFGKRLRAWWHK